MSAAPALYHVTLATCQQKNMYFRIRRNKKKAFFGGQAGSGTATCQQQNMHFRIKRNQKKKAFFGKQAGSGTVRADLNISTIVSN